MDKLKKLMHIFSSPALSLVLRWTGQVKGRLIISCLTAMASMLCSLAMTLVTRGLIDSAVSSRQEDLIRYGILFVLLMLTVRFISVFSATMRVGTNAKVQKNLQGQLMSGLLSSEYGGIKKYHSGELVSRVFSDASVVKNGIVSMLPMITSMVVSFTGAAIILAAMDWRLVVVLIAVGLMGACGMLFFRGPMKRRHARMQQAESHLHASVQETLENIRLVKASLSEDRIMKRVWSDQAVLESEQRRQGYFSIAMNNSMGVVFDISYLACMLWGCSCIFRGELTYGALAAIIQLMGRIQGPISGAADLAGQAYSVISSAERLQELLDLPRENETNPVKDFDSIVLDDVSFIYDDGSEEVLRNISCVISKGDFVALTGISGGGKTSLFQLLLGIYTPTSGSITFKNGEGSVPASRDTRGLFAYVPQGNTLISGTLRENLTLFAGDATDEQVMAAARASCIEPLISEMGLDAVIGERGVGLSEGQAQRVCVARALLSGAPILLLDEATSALDEETEARLLSNISEMRDKTCLIVTHRRAALDICGRQLNIKEGRMVQETIV